jgi:hypothetical protein
MATCNAIETETHPHGPTAHLLLCADKDRRLKYADGASYALDEHIPIRSGEGWVRGHRNIPEKPHKICLQFPNRSCCSGVDGKAHKHRHPE